jgi:hypothetical protein
MPVSSQAAEVTFHVQRTGAEYEVPAELGHVPNSPHKLRILDEHPLCAHL